jgi:hypothetical protein
VVSEASSMTREWGLGSRGNQVCYLTTISSQINMMLQL